MDDGIRDGLAAILTRRSIRRYEPRPVENEIVERLLRAAMSAPSAGNEQPWHFVVLRDRAMLDSVPEVHPHSRMLKEVSVAIVVCGDPAVEIHPGYWVLDCAAATENILIAATALGLGTVWLGVFPREDRVRGVRDLLGIPEHIIPFSIVPVGYAAESKPPAERYSEARVHEGRW
jgi:nitroreductase